LKEEWKPSVGAYLRQERERKNISLADMAEATRISRRYLEALEKDEFQSLPASIFVRSFLRAYAVYIKVDPQEVLDMYEAQTISLPAAEKMEPPSSPKKFEPLAKYILLLILIALGVGITFYFFKETLIPAPSSLPAPGTSLPPAAPLAEKSPSEPLFTAPTKPARNVESEKPAMNMEKLPSAAPVAAEEGQKKERKHVLKVKAMEKTWLSLRCDDQPEVEALLQPKQSATWTARRQFRITIGNAGGVEIYLNGKSQGPLGESGQVVHLLLPQDIEHREEEKKEQ